MIIRVLIKYFIYSGIENKTQNPFQSLLKINRAYISIVLPRKINKIFIILYHSNLIQFLWNFHFWETCATTFIYIFTNFNSEFYQVSMLG